MSTVAAFPLSTAVRVYNEVRRRIAEEYDMDESDPFVLGSAEGETDLSEALIHLLRQAREREALADACKRMADETASRAARHKASAERLRAIVEWAMAEARLPKVEAPDVGAQLVAGRPSVAVIDEDLIPEHLCRIRREPNKTAILAELQAERNVPGAALNNARPALRVKWS